VKHALLFLLNLNSGWARIRYVQKVLDIVYSRTCVKREAIIREVAQSEGIDDVKKVENAVNQVLRRLVRKGLVVRKATGYYCKP
jgi:predicted transcriptional regulator